MRVKGPAVESRCMIGVDQDLIRRIGYSIGLARERAGITVEQVAIALGISPDLLRDVETGNINACAELDLVTFLRIARAVGIAARNILLDE